MPDIPNPLFNSLKIALKQCRDKFFSQQDIWHSLDNEKLRTWRDAITEADNYDKRLEYVIDYLKDKENIQGQNALYLLLLALSDRYEAEDMRHDLLKALANQVQLMTSVAHSIQDKSSLVEEANPTGAPMTAISDMPHIMNRARAVCHIRVPRYRNRKCKESGSGSGWLIAPGLVITCWHVIAALFPGDPQPEQSDVNLQVQQTLILFDYTQTGKGIEYSVTELIYPSVETQEQDFAILRLEDRDDYPYSQFDYLPIEWDAPLNRQVSLSIIQHPMGKEQQWSSGNFADFVNESGRILYTTPTEHGTSGAPVLKHRNWSVVALHNGESRSRGLREGTTIESILKELEKNIPDLYREIMQAQPKINATPTVNSEASVARNAIPPQNAPSISDQTPAQRTSDMSQNKDVEKQRNIQDTKEHRPQSKVIDLGVNIFQKNQQEFDTLLDKLLNNNGASRIGLVGMGGKGKSRLAYEMVQHLKALKAFPAEIYWMIPEIANKLPRASSEEVKQRAWEADFANFAEYCEYLPTDDNEQSSENNARRARHICKYLASNSDCLIVLDNTEDPQYAVNAISTIVGGTAQCAILYTSRWSDKPKVLYGGKDIYLHKVEKLPDDQALQLLLEKCPGILESVISDKKGVEADTVRAILEQVDGLPLTLWLLSGLLEEDKDYHTSLLQLLEELKKSGQIEIFDADAKAQEMLRRVFTLSWERIESADAKRLLQLMSYYPTITAIPLHLMSIAMGGGGEQNDLSFKFSLANIHLQKLSLVEKLSSEEVRLHSLICEMTQEHIKLVDDTSKFLCEQAANHLLDTFTKLNNLAKHAQKQGYWQCLKMVKQASQYVQSLDNDRSEPLSRLAYWLQYESNLLGNDQFWPEPLPELLYQQIYNHFVEENGSYKQEDPPERWIPLERSSGKNNSSTLWTHGFSTFADIRGLALSPDGMQIALALYELERSQTSIKIYERVTGYLQFTIANIRLGPVIAMAFTLDSKQIIAGDATGHIIGWDAKDGEMRREHKLNPYESFTCLAFSPDVTIAAAGTSRGRVYLYHIEKEEEIHLFPCCNTPIEEVVFSHNNRIAARAANEISIWDREKGIHLNQIKQATRCLKFSPDNKWLVCGGVDGCIYVQESPHQTAKESSDQTLQRISLNYAYAVTFLAFLPDGTKIVVGQQNISTHILNRKSARSITLEVGAELSDQQEDATHVVFSSDSTCMITAGKSGIIHARDVIKVVQFQQRSWPIQKIEDIVFSSGGATVLTLTSKQQLQQWNVDSNQEVEVLSSDVIGKAERIMCIASHPPSKLFALGTLSGRILLGDCEHPENLAELEPHEKRVTCLAFSPDGSMLATGSNNKEIHLYKIATKHPMKILSGPSGPIACLAFTSDGSHLVTGGSNGIIGLWNRVTGIFSQLEHKQNLIIKQVCVLYESNKIIAGTNDGKVYTWIERGSSSSESLAFCSPTSSEISLLACAPLGKLAVICWSNRQTDFIHITDKPEGKIYLVGKVTTSSRIKAIYWKDDRRFVLAGVDEATGYPSFYHFVLEGDWFF